MTDSGDKTIKKQFHVLDLRPKGSTSSKPSELIQIRGHENLTLNARRSITVLWHNAHSQGIEPGKDYTIEIDQLIPNAHKGYEMVEEAIEALMKTLVIIPLPDGTIRRVAVLGGNDMSEKGNRSGTLTYSFDQRLIDILGDSTVWGKISIPELMAFNFRYSVSLYEHVSQWFGLNHKQKTFSLEEFRELLGVKTGKYKGFGQLNQQVIRPVVAEINALAAFNLIILPVKTGRSVTHITLSWWEKTVEEKKAAYQEALRPKFGRRARLENRVEYVLPPSQSPQRLAKRDKPSPKDDEVIE